MTDNNRFAQFVPGFDFLQGLVKNASSALPGMTSWVAPTLNPEELGKRIDELRTVQYWLEQNARMLATTIQALEVQRMTLSTLKTMNVPLAELRDSLKMPVPPSPEPAAAQGVSALPVDPTQWWTALTQQFTQLAANAIKDSTTDAAKDLAGTLMKQSFDAASDTLRQAATVPGAVMDGVAQGLKRTGAQPRARPQAAAGAPARAKPAANKTPAAPRRRG